MTSIWIGDVTPRVDEGRHAAKCIVGERCDVEADIFRDGHAALLAVVRWQVPRLAFDGHEGPEEGWQEAPLRPLPITNGESAVDRWHGSFIVERLGVYTFVIQAWTDRYGSWLRNFGKKVRARKDVGAERIEGRSLLLEVAGFADAEAAATLGRYASLFQLAPDDTAALHIASEQLLVDTMARCDHRRDAATSAPYRLHAERERAAYGAWYELFPRSQGGGAHGTFTTAAARLPEIAELGFDVVYLPPIHPVGKINRKGRNNTLTSTPGDPGSPWAIGSSDGGHDAIEPALGTLADFDQFVATANRLGLEVALDFAIQCAPDHPWVKEHPSWFFHRPDGTIKYAENPPKEYQDVYPIDFETKDIEALKDALLHVLLFWIDHGVHIFRVDNPHTKPLWLWEWLIAEVQHIYPDIVFLAEAFTRPKMMYALGQVGFSQSYTYFTWRTTKAELTAYATELSTRPVRDFYRPNFFANTPDILPKQLQTSSPAVFKQRLVLAATLSPSYGIYSGYELCEGAAVADTEEYLDSEKYELKQRNYDAPGNLKAYIARVNAARRANPALQRMTPITFMFINNDDLILFARSTEDHSNVVIVAVNLDPNQMHEARCYVPPEVVGVAPGQRYGVVDLLTGARFEWGQDNYVRLDPSEAVAHVFRVEKR